MEFYYIYNIYSVWFCWIRMPRTPPGLKNVTEWCNHLFFCKLPPLYSHFFDIKISCNLVDPSISDEEIFQAAITKANLGRIKISQNQIPPAVSESSSEAEAGPLGEALNTAVFPDKHSTAWGGFGADRRACSSLRRPPGEVDWINSSLKGFCSLRGHKGNVGTERENGGALSGSHRTAACLYTRLLLHKYCTICCTTEMIPPVSSFLLFLSIK